jgi:hypothetical protein
MAAHSQGSREVSDRARTTVRARRTRRASDEPKDLVPRGGGAGRAARVTGRGSDYRRYWFEQGRRHGSNPPSALRPIPLSELTAWLVPTTAEILVDLAALPIGAEESTDP